MKFYNLNGTWVSWDTLHNEYGYTTEESLPVTYKSAKNNSTWGQSAGCGYFVGDMNDMIHGSFWCDSDIGWFDMDGLVWNPEIYPSDATDLMLENSGVVSAAVKLNCNGTDYYLIKEIVDTTAWITASEAEALGWVPYEPSFGNCIIWDDTAGEILSSFFYEAIIGLSSSVPLETFYFTQNGIDEEEDSLLPTMGYDIDLYDADGNRAADPAYNNVRPLTYMHADGNMFPYGDDTIIINSGVDLLGLMSDEEDNRTAWSAQVEKIFRVSFTQTQLPDVTVPMPSDLRGVKGASVTLPSVSGVYQKNGKAYVPSSWNIGAFGSSYTINGDVVATLNFTEGVIVGGIMTSTTDDVIYMDLFGGVMTADA